MAYTKQTFTAGQTLKASDLNTMSQGIVDKQDKLVSGTNIKTVNGQSLLGEGNISVSNNVGEEAEVVKTIGEISSTTNNLRGGAVDFLICNPSFISKIIGKKITKISFYKVVDSGDSTKATVTIGKVAYDVNSFTANSTNTAPMLEAYETLSQERTYDLSGYENKTVIQLDCDITLNDGECLCFYVKDGHCVGYENGVSNRIYYPYGGMQSPDVPQGIQLALEYVEKASTIYNPIGKFDGKTVSVVGDSISTFSGYIPSGYATFYPSSAIAQGGTGSLTSVEQTWWHKLCKELGLKLLRNASWSGSYVTGNSSSTSAIVGCSDIRISDLAGSDGSTPDIVIVYIGINDLFNSDVSSRGTTLGDWTPDQEIPEGGTVTEFSSAYALMLKKIITTYPDAKVFCCTLLTTARNYKDTDGTETFPTKHAGVTLNQVNNKIREIALGIGCNVIDVHACGINYFNIKKYTIDTTHPNASGAELIKNQMLAELIAKY